MAAASLVTFLRTNAEQGNDPGVGGVKKMPLLSRLAGGMKAWGAGGGASRGGEAHEKVQAVPQHLPSWTQGSPQAGVSGSGGHASPIGAMVVHGRSEIDMDAVAEKLASAVELR